MAQLTKQQVLRLLWEEPYKIGHWVGFKDLTPLHNEWLRMFLYSTKDETLQGHRGSFKTTVLGIAFSVILVAFPNQTIIFFRKTERDVAEVMRLTSNILQTGCMQEIVYTLYGKELKLIKDTNSEIHTNLAIGVKGSSQLVGLGIFSSITGKHADIVATDDIINISDRVSTAERERTKLAYMELQNIKNRGGRFINTGTPWHKDDAFTLMPEPVKYDCYSTGLMTEEEIADLRLHMAPSLFAANYELRHIASENILFTEPVMGVDVSAIFNGIAHVDSAFYGEDYTAFTIMTYHDGAYFIFGKLWRKNVEDCYGDIMKYYNRFLCSKLHMEKNADKGMVARDLKRLGIRTVPYDESMNKHIKIVTYLKAIWPEVRFIEGTDPEYIEQITDYTENAAHDDAPDSAACLARLMYRKANRRSPIEYLED